MLKITSLILIVIGFLLFLVGTVFVIFNFSDMFNGIYSGPLILSIGIIMNFLIPKRLKGRNNRGAHFK